VRSSTTGATGLRPNMSPVDLLIAVAEATAKPDGYTYGAVAAPDWALPVGAFGVVLLAGIPILLAPGEKALDAQRENEATKGVKFGRKPRNDDV
jgi:hypothetical protein